MTNVKVESVVRARWPHYESLSRGVLLLLVYETEVMHGYTCPQFHLLTRNTVTVVILVIVPTGAAASHEPLLWVDGHERI